MLRASAPTITFSRAVIDLKSRMFWNVRAIPSLVMSCRLQPRQRLAVEADLTARGLVDAGHHVEAGGLAGAVRPDQAEDLALLDVEGHLVERGDATEPDGDVVDLEDRLAGSRVSDIDGLPFQLLDLGLGPHRPSGTPWREEALRTEGHDHHQARPKISSRQSLRPRKRSGR